MQICSKSYPEIIWAKAFGISSGYSLHHLHYHKYNNAPKSRKPKSYQDTLKIAKDTNKKILFLFTSSKCEWCQKMREETMHSMKVQQAIESYVYFEVDWKRYKNLCERYGINSYPSYRIVELKDDKEIVCRSGSGFKCVEDFINWIQ